MQSSLMKRFLVSTIAIALAWTVAPLSQAAPVDECELTAEGPRLQSQPSVPLDECEWAPDPVLPLAEAQPQANQELGVEKTHPNSPIFQTELGEESQNFKTMSAQESGRARPGKEIVMRKPRREMDDQEMDGTCGGITGSFDITGNGNMTLNDSSAQSIALSDQAQQNLSSVVNILSVNSTISVMLNLNVNINSTVGTLNQGNSGTQNTGVQNTMSHP